MKQRIFGVIVAVGLLAGVVAAPRCGNRRCSAGSGRDDVLDLTVLDT